MIHLFFEFAASELNVRAENAEGKLLPITLLLDEFVRLGRLEQVRDLPALSRGAGVNVVLLAQDTLSQFYACLHELHTLHEQLRRIGINLNQLARQANEGRLVAPDDFARVNAEISNQVDEVERVLRHVSTSSSVLARRTGKKARRPSA